MKDKKTIIIIAIVAVVAICICLTALLLIGALTANDETPTPKAISNIIATIQPPAEIPASATAIPPTYTSEPTFTATPAPTYTPLPTATPTETPPPTSTPAPITFTGQGDAVLDIDLPEPGFLHIKGNSEGGLFAVISYSATGEYLDLLVNVTEPYEGRRPIGWEDEATRLSISATGPWEITYYPLLPAYAHTLTVPGEYQGAGDDVILFQGGIPDIATITGNASGRFMAIIAYDTGYLSLLVNTTDPYQGSVIIPGGAIFLDVQTIDPFTIQVSGR